MRSHAILPPGTTTIEQVCRLDTAIGQQFAEVAAGLAARVLATATSTWCARTGRRSSTGSRSPGRAERCSSASRRSSPSGPAQRSSATSARATSPREVTVRRSRACSTCSCSVRMPEHVCGSLNLGGIANVTVVGPDREPIAFDTGPASALLDAVVSSASGGRETFDRGWAGRGAGHGRRRAARTLPRRAVLRRPAAEVDRQGALPPRLRPRAGRRAADRAGRSARDADGALGRGRRGRPAPVRGRRGRRGRRWHPEPDADARARATSPGRPDHGRSTTTASPSRAKEALVFALIGFLTVHRLPGRRSHRAPAPHARPCSAPSPLERAP